MATLVFTAIGAQLGGSLLGGVVGAGIAGAVGKAVGGTVGRYVDEKLFGSSTKPRASKPAELMRVTTAHHGAPIRQFYGRNRVAGHLIWSGGFRSEQKGKGHKYYASFALALGEGEIHRIGRVWHADEEIVLPAGKWRFYSGKDDQNPDPLIQAKEGFEQTPGYRDLSYIVFEDLDLTPYYNRIPQFQFEVFRHPRLREGEARDSLKGVCIIPGSGEYVYSTQAVEMKHAPGKSEYANHARARSKSDFLGSIEDLQTDLPNCKSASLVVSWFGDDLRADKCRLTPRVDQRKTDGTQAWRVSGVMRQTAQIPTILEGNAVYGGTPDDQSVIDAIRSMRQRNIDVMFYPFILMDIPKGNGLSCPYGNQEQAINPWRGRITFANSSLESDELTEIAVKVFAGKARREDFQIRDGVVVYNGPEEWSYRRFILHYAYLCKAAGGVNEFLIGSELVGLTQIHAGGLNFPFVRELIKLAADCRAILGGDTKIGYAADWSEYFGYAPQDLSGAFYFHLDDLWADQNIDFIGIDNYMPISDWRYGKQNLDGDFGSIYRREYLQSQIEGGEGFDWYYRSDDDRKAQIRTPITDGQNAPWIWRYKDIKNWWSNLHHHRPDGEASSAPTKWKPASKPIYFTEFGAAAIDLSTNQPNKFIDPKSSESSLPFHSKGAEDPFIQAQYIQAICDYWSCDENNPSSAIYGGNMIDVDKCYYWCWDARPWPEFPARSDLWSDADNYQRGHWINGRVNAPKLANVILDICAPLGAENVDVSEVYGQIAGIGFHGDETVGAKLQTIMRAYQIDAFFKDRKLHFVSRGYRHATKINTDWLVANNKEGAPWQITHDVQTAMPARFELGYVAGDEDYENHSAVAQYPKAQSDNKDGFSTNLVLSEKEAQSLAELYFCQFEYGKERLKFGIANLQKLNVGDVIKFEEANVHDYMVSKISMGSFQEVEAFAVRNDARDLGLAQPSSITNHLSTFLPWVVVLDLPCFKRPQSHVFASHKYWSSALAIELSNSRDERVLETEITNRSIMGALKTPLEIAVSDLAQYVNIVVEFIHNQSELPVQKNASMPVLALGEGEQWELIGIADYEWMDRNKIRVRKVYRGLFHTQILAHRFDCHAVILGSEHATLHLEDFGADAALEMTFAPISGQGEIYDKIYIKKPNKARSILPPVNWRMRGNRLEFIALQAFDWDYWDDEVFEQPSIEMRVEAGEEIVHEDKSEADYFVMPLEIITDDMTIALRAYGSNGSTTGWARLKFSEIRRI